MENVKTVVKPTMEEVINSLFDKVDAKRAQVQLAEKPSYVTGGQFRYSQDSPGGMIDISTVREERKLVEIGAFLIERAKAYAAAAEKLGCNVEFSWFRFSVDEWMKDLKTRVDSLQVNKLRIELDVMEAKLNAIMPEDMRKAKELEKLLATMENM